MCSFGLWKCVFRELRKSSILKEDLWGANLCGASTVIHIVYSDKARTSPLQAA